MNAKEHLAATTKALEQVMEEYAAMDRHEATAKAEIDSAVDTGEIHSEKEHSRLSKAALQIQIIPGARKKAIRQIAVAMVSVQQAMKWAVSYWDSGVQAEKRRVFEALIQAITPFYGGALKDKLTRKEFSAMHVPARDRLNKAFCHLEDLDHMPENTLAAARRLLDRFDNLEAQFGLTMPETMLAREVPMSGLPDPEKKVKVRALVAMAVDDKKLKAGEETELSEQQYAAVSRHLEKIS
jgi:hypothetical protein